MERCVLSKYNYFNFFESTVIGVNLVNKTLFAIGIEKYNLLQSHVGNLEALYDIDPTLFSLMYKLGVIQEEEEDNSVCNALLMKNRQLNFGERRYNLCINPTLNCNFSCWYCYETHNKKHMSKQIIDSTIKYINHILSSKQFSTFTLGWFGGEPLLCYENVLRPISYATKEICENNGVLLESSITTNGYLIKDEMIPFFKEINMHDFQITLDGSKEIHDSIRNIRDKRGSYDQIVNNIILLAKELNPYNLALRINYTAGSINSVFEIIDSFPMALRGRITILLQQVWQDRDKEKIDVAHIENLKEKFRNVGFKVDENILNCKGYVCYADKYNQALINYDGRVFKCTKRDFEKEKEDGLLTEDGRIEWHPSMAEKTIKATFENDRCMKCKYLPICFGFCSQKVSLLKNHPENFDKYCYKSSIINTLDFVMSEFQKSNLGLAPLLQYR